jgi:hypothetical protein
MLGSGASASIFRRTPVPSDLTEAAGSSPVIPPFLSVSWKAAPFFVLIGLRHG